ncbi:neuroglobin-like isoform X1 [Babylonia areolata]|uniref:neuroglobin-like isoform X1 n=1 Tax=Babylonia areolata TaxID=304850 RepID=UPI003FD1CAAF
MGCIRDKPLKGMCRPEEQQQQRPCGGGGGGGGGSGGRGGAVVEEDAVVVGVGVGEEVKNGPQSKMTAVANFSHVVQDPRMPLTVRQCFSLVQSWKAIKRNISQTGVEMFIRLFKSNGDLKNMFHAFKDLSSDDDMRSNESLENHATLVMTTLDDAITHIDNFDYVSEVLRKTGASHVRFEGFTSDNFWNIREPFLEAVKITLGDRYTDNMEGIYKVAISFILQTMSDGMDEAIKAKAQDNS